jgi:hypothetical protein
LSLAAIRAILQAVRLKFVACAVLSAALALVAAPGIVGSRTPSPVRAVEAAAFQPLQIDASASAPPVAVSDDPALRSAGSLDDSARFDEPAVPTASVTPPRAAVRSQPIPVATSSIKPPKEILTGTASFYDNGTTAMRLPAGTVIRVCGAGGCIERVVNDYGPSASFKPARLIDLYRPDFFKVCGCPSWSGLAKVTVSVY